MTGSPEIVVFENDHNNSGWLVNKHTISGKKLSPQPAKRSFFFQTGVIFPSFFHFDTLCHYSILSENLILTGLHHFSLGGFVTPGRVLGSFL